MKVVIAGGGTAGHVFPALALAGALERGYDAEISFLGTATGLEGRLVPEAGYPFTPVRAAPLRRTPSVAMFRAPFTALGSVADCGPEVADADAVVGVGGYVSVPAVLAGVRARRPVALHEQNAIPGLANRLLARFATVVALSFEEARGMLSKRPHVVVTGNPVRETVLSVPANRSDLAARARERFGLDPDRMTVLVFGGSQGALRIDHAIADAIEHLQDRNDLQLLVLTGRGHLGVVSEPAEHAGSLRVIALEFCDEMELAYAAADVVVARAGATTIAEVTVCGLPSLLIPYPHATGNHQAANALAVQRAGAAAILHDDDLSGPLLTTRLRELLDDDDRLSAMAHAATGFGRPDAAGALAAEVATIARSRT
ncbi:MAG: undecaprenyldiphospho-muramoylpentapeptide beta-N-acetylglucosaminyltransferase [Actinomycetota bacterium]